MNAFLCFCFTLSAAALHSAATGEQRMNLHGEPGAERFVLTDKVWPANHGDADICLWKDDAFAAVTFTIDDNSVWDHEWWIQTCREYDIHATWFVISDYAEKIRVRGPWSKFQTLRDYGHDIGSHTVTHLTTKHGYNPDDPEHGLEYEYAASIIAIEKNVTNTVVKTLAYPGSPPHTNCPALASQYYNAMRGTLGTINPANQINYTRTRSVSGAFYIDAADGGGKWNSFSAVLQTGNPYYRGWYCMHYHTLDDARKNRIINGLNYLRHKDQELGIWIGTFTDVTLYGQERDTAALNVTSIADTRIDFTLSDDMKDNCFDYPLTVKVRVNNDWTNVAATQNGNAVGANLIEHAGNKYALVQAVPDKGPVSLVKAMN